MKSEDALGRLHDMKESIPDIIEKNGPFNATMMVSKWDAKALSLALGFINDHDVEFDNYCRRVDQLTSEPKEPIQK
jgi:hypothetical protein